MNTLKQLWVAVVGSVVMFAYSLFADDGGLSNQDWLKIANMLVGAYLVWQTTNGPVGSGAWQYAKTIALGSQALLVGVLSALSGGGITSTEWFQIAIAVLTAAGVLVTPGVRLVKGSNVLAESRVVSNALG